MRLDPNENELPVLGSSPRGEADRPAEADRETLEAMDAELERELRAFEDAERERLGLGEGRRQWVDEMLQPEVKRNERETITLLVAGLTAAQDFLVEGALRGVGYQVRNIGTADTVGLQLGKEFGNRGQCNPTYFMVGNLVKTLTELRDRDGLSTQEIVANYVFLTAGACGPCRFGMYVTEYRKALRDAGFDGFRVMLFQQQGGLAQATGEELGLEFNPKFFIAIIKALSAGDVVNAMGYRVRPYEVQPGAAQAAVEGSKRLLYEALYKRTNIFLALFRCRKLFEAVKVDRLRPRAKVAIIGEFWAMTTEGDGNYHLQKFLESEGAENDIQLTTAWLLYNIWEVARDTRERKHLKAADGGPAGLQGYDEFGITKRLAAMRVADRALRVLFECFARPIGLKHFHLADMDEIAEIARPYYSNDLRGGEGHMEVGKLIYNVTHSRAHMTLSVKPFGCMPSSSVSDGVQSLVQSRHPGSLYCAVETSGDGATNFYSRVQMFMFKARQAAEEELARTYTECGVTEAEVRRFLAEHPSYNSALHVPPEHGPCTAANLVREVAPLIRQSKTERTLAWFGARARSISETAAQAPKAARKAVDFVRSEETRANLVEDSRLLAEVIAGRARDNFGPLLTRLGAGELVKGAAPLS
jgi:predicted nucleotide-binding protein (sugar kinase/HSP70/actin superfamily)